MILYRSMLMMILSLFSLTWRVAAEICKDAFVDLESHLAFVPQEHREDGIPGETIVNCKCYDERYSTGDGCLARCNLEGRWELVNECRRLKCKQPPVIENGSWTTFWQLEDGGVYDFYSNVVYTCDEGYEFEEVIEKNMMTCENSGDDPLSPYGVWQSSSGDRKFPVCIDCGPPPKVTEFGATLDDFHKTILGSTANFECPEGHQMLGQ